MTETQCEASRQRHARSRERERRDAAAMRVLLEQMGEALPMLPADIRKDHRKIVRRRVLAAAFREIERQYGLDAS